MHVSRAFQGESLLRRLINAARSAALAVRWLFAWVFLAQLGHLIEHINMAIQGRGLVSPALNSELSHLVFNALIAVLSMLLVIAYPRNPWTYPLVVLSLVHGIEHVFVYARFLETGVPGGPGLLAKGGELGLLPLGRVDLHNAYNALELVLMTLGLRFELDRYWREVDVARPV